MGETPATNYALLKPDSSVDHHQRQGMALDIIDEALNEYRGFMLDDDYNAQGALDRIMTRMSERRSALNPT